MPFSKTLKFSKRPRAIFCAGTEVPRTYSLKEIEALRKAAYDRGLADAVADYEQKLSKGRTDILDSQIKTFEALEGQHEALIAQVSHALPELTMEAIRRVLAIVQIDPETVTSIVEELLAQTSPVAGALEVALSGRDLKLFEGNQERFSQKYPGIHFAVDPELKPGDCIVRSRFGVLDGRVETKLQHIEALLQ
jgi:flagellar assembly protein FliH